MELKILLVLCSTLLISCSWRPKSDDSTLIESLKKNNKQLGKPKEGEWLFQHSEPGQTFQKYKTQQPVRPDSIRKIIYLLPIGDFSKDQKKLIEDCRDYLSRFFEINSKILPVVPDDTISVEAKRKRKNGSIQLLAPYILELLRKKMPPDAVVLMAITEKDLYPKPSWNFVFGLASIKNKVAVTSIYRYSDTIIDPLNYPLSLQRLIKTSTHEIGHMFSMHHCTYAVCLMNGCNNLDESDSKPNRLCSECLSKMNWNLNFDLKKRQVALVDFFASHKLSRDYKESQADLKLLLSQ